MGGSGQGWGSSFLTVFILLVIMGSDTPQCLPRIIAGPVISSISGTFSQTVINQVSSPPFPPSWWKRRHREVRPLSQRHTADAGKMGCFASDRLVWDGGSNPIPLGGRPLSLPWLGGPAPHSWTSAFLEALGAFQGGLLITAG